MSADPITILDKNGQSRIIDEGESCDIPGKLLKPNGSAITPSDAATIRLTLYSKSSGSIINGWDGSASASIKNTNNATTDDDGKTLRIRLQPADNTIEESTAVDDTEWHVARITFTWNDGTAIRTGVTEYQFKVRNVAAPT